MSSIRKSLTTQENAKFCHICEDVARHVSMSGKGYHEGTPWEEGKKRWVCDDPLCGFDALDEVRMIMHREEFHTVKKVLRDSGLVDEQGNPIVIEKDEED